MVHKVVHKYLLQRGQNWYFRWRVPAHLISVFGRSEIKRSLRTVNKDEASARAAGFFLVVNDLKDEIVAAHEAVEEGKITGNVVLQV